MNNGAFCCLAIAGTATAIIGVLALSGWARQENVRHCAAQGGRYGPDGTYSYIWQITDYKTGAGYLLPIENERCFKP